MIAPLVSSNSSLLNPTFISLESVLKLQYMFFLLNILQKKNIYCNFNTLSSDMNVGFNKEEFEDTKGAIINRIPNCFFSSFFF
jgi:hypothetical protein